jgi:hypothetical protein
MALQRLHTLVSPRRECGRDLRSGGGRAAPAGLALAALASLTLTAATPVRLVTLWRPV